MGLSDGCRKGALVSGGSKYISVDSPVLHMEMDRFKPGSLLYSDFSSTLKTTDGKDVEIIVGSDVPRYSQGYAEGVGMNAKFGFIYGFHQVNDSLVLAADSSNFCVRSINRNSKQTGEFSGDCTSQGYEEGEAGKFSFPTCIISDNRSPGKVIVADTFNNALRHLDVNTKVLETFYRHTQNGPGDRPFYPLGLTQDVDTGAIFITSSNNVHRLNYNDMNLELLASDWSDRYVDVYLYDVLLIANREKLLVTSSESNKVLVFDLITDDWVAQTQTYSVMDQHAMAIGGDVLYVGGGREIAKFV